MTDPVVSVVAPAHNEEDSLSRFTQNVVAELSSVDHEIILVDDGSTDMTWRTILGLRNKYPQIRAIRFTRNFGHQSAILAGLTAARGEAVIMMDSDGQHPESLIPRLIESWRNGHDVVQAVRTQTAREGILKRITSTMFYSVLGILSGMKVPRGAADFRLMSRTAVDAVLHSAGPQFFLRGLISWMAFPTSYVPFNAEARSGGRSSYTWRRMIRLSIDGLMTFSIIPLRIAIALGLSISLLSFLYLVYIVVIWLTSTRVVPGWASVAGLLSLLGGIQLLTIGVLGEYLGRLFLSNLNRPHFVIKEQL